MAYITLKPSHVQIDKYECPMNVHTHTHTHTHTDTHTHTHTHTRTHTDIHTCAHSVTHIHIHLSFFLNFAVFWRTQSNNCQILLNIDIAGVNHASVLVMFLMILVVSKRLILGLFNVYIAVFLYQSKTLEKYRLAISNNYMAYRSKRKSHVTPGRTEVLITIIVNNYK